VLTLFFILGLIAWFLASSEANDDRPHPDARWRGTSGFMGTPGWDRDSNGNYIP